MNFKKIITAAVFALMGLIGATEKASAYSATITWPGPGVGIMTLSFIIEGTAMNGKGTFEKSFERIVDNGNHMVTINHAGSFKGPLELYPGWTYHLNFNGVNIGKCFDMPQTAFGVKYLVDVQTLDDYQVANDKGEKYLMRGPQAKFADFSLKVTDPFGYIVLDPKTKQPIAKKPSMQSSVVMPIQTIQFRNVENGFYGQISSALSDLGGGIGAAGTSVSAIQDPQGIAKMVGAATSAVGSIVGSVGNLVKISSCKNWRATVTWTKDAGIVALTPSF